MTLLNSLLSLDLSLLQWARTLISPQYAWFVQIAWELVVIYAAVILVILWLYGIYRRDDQHKRSALAIFYTIVGVFALYTIINLWLPQWRPGAIEAVGGIAPLIPHPIDNSFPSGHALFTGALLIGLVRYLRSGSIIMSVVIIGLITLIARILGWVHYPGDIIAGLIFGIWWAYVLGSLVDSTVRFTAPLLIRIASWIKL